MGEIKNKNGYVFVLSLILILVLSIYIMAIITASTLQRKSIIRNGFEIQAFYNAESGLVRAAIQLKDNKLINKNSKKHKEDIGVKSFFEYDISPHGGYLKIISKGVCKDEVRVLSCLLAQKATSMQETSITMLEKNSSITGAGKTSIKGDVVLQGGKIQRSRMNVLPFIGKTVVNGKSIELDSSTAFAEGEFIEEQMVSHRDMFKNPEGYDLIFHHSLVFDSEDRYDSRIYKNKIIYVEGDLIIRDKNSVFGPALFYVENSLIIKDDTEIADVDFVCRKSLKVSGSARITNSTLFSYGKAMFSNKASLQLQLVNRDSVIIKNSAIFNYPSLIYVTGKRYDRKLRGCIIISDNVKIDGCVMYNHVAVDEKKYSLPGTAVIKIGKNVRLNGFLYSSRAVDISGLKIYGNVSVGSFFFYRRPRRYKNWLYNVIIDRSAVSKDLLLPVLFGKAGDYCPISFAEITDE